VAVGFVFDRRVGEGDGAERASDEADFSIARPKIPANDLAPRAAAAG